MNTQPTDDESQIRAAFENHCRSFGWSEGRLARWQVDDESLPPAVRGAYMIGSVQQMWQSWCAGAKWGTPATGGEPVGWEWRWKDTSPHTVTSGQWSEWKRVEARSRLSTVEDAVREFQHYIADGAAYELRQLYTSPQPVREPLNEAQVAEWLNLHGLTLAKTSSGYEVLKLGKAVAHGITGGQHGTE